MAMFNSYVSLPEGMMWTLIRFMENILNCFDGVRLLDTKLKLGEPNISVPWILFNDA